MAKVNIKSKKITPFGGIYYASKAFMRFHLTKSSTALLVFAAPPTTAVPLHVDFDHVFVKTEKADATYSYKQACSYFPGVVSIDSIIAYIENPMLNTISHDLKLHRKISTLIIGV